MEFINFDTFVQNADKIKLIEVYLRYVMPSKTTLVKI